MHREPCLLPPFSPPDGFSLHVEGVIVFPLEIRLLQEGPGLVGVRLAMVHAEGGAVAALVAEVVHVEDLLRLVDLEAFFACDRQSAVSAGEHGQRPVDRLDVVRVVGPVRADLDALVAEGRALETTGFAMESCDHDSPRSAAERETEWTGTRVSP